MDPVGSQRPFQMHLGKTSLGKLVHEVHKLNPDEVPSLGDPDT